MSQRRNRVKQTRSLEERMAEQATKLKEQASQLPAGPERTEASQARRDWGAHQRLAQISRLATARVSCAKTIGGRF